MLNLIVINIKDYAQSTYHNNNSNPNFPSEKGILFTSQVYSLPPNNNNKNTLSLEQQRETY